jgi:hypothetical protein
LATGFRTPYPRYLYKYKPPALDPTGDPARYLREILVESRLWLSSPKDFNDPFDMTARIVFEGTSEAKRQRFERLIAQRTELSPGELQHQLENAMALSDSEWLERARHAVSSNLQKTGVCSFTGDPKSVLMWSHYGGQHTGICLQFEVARDPRNLLHAVRARYVDDYPVVNWVEDTFEQIKTALLHKFKMWKYEEERRIIWPEGARTNLPFEAAALVGLIFGCRASDAAIGVVRTMLAERRARGLSDVRVYRAVEHGSRYALVIRRMVA